MRRIWEDPWGLLLLVVGVGGGDREYGVLWAEVEVEDRFLAPRLMVGRGMWGGGLGC